MKIKVTSKTLAAGAVEGEGKIMHPIPRLNRQRAASLFGDESGAATAEYAITTMATVDEIEQISRCLT